jgi:zinc transporter ZupT
MPDTKTRPRPTAPSTERPAVPDAEPNGAAARAPDAALLARFLLPLVLLAALVAILLRFGPLGVLKSTSLPVEDVVIQKVALPAANEIRVTVVNGGADPVTIAQVMVDDASWLHTIDADRVLKRLDTRTITIPYPWVEGERHVVRIITATGVTFDAEVAAAVQTPRADAQQLGMFAMLGVYVGVVPVLLGLLWLPFLRRVQQNWLDFFLAFTVGLLVFLGVDTIDEALSMAASVPGAYQGLGIVLLGASITALALFAIGRVDSPVETTATHASSASGSTGTGGAAAANRMALLVAIGIGLHNLGEGLAVGSAIAAGEAALGTFLVLGFLLHNTTEGLAIVAPLATGRPAIRRLVVLGLLAGLPTIAGAWIGGLTHSPILTTLFFAIGAGAILQVIFVLWGFFAGKERGLTSPLNAAGFALGLIVMYATGLFVAA